MSQVCAVGVMDRRNHRPLGRNVGARWRCVRDPLDQPLPAQPNIARIRRAIKTLQIDALLNEGRDNEAAALWCDVTADYILSTTHDPTGKGTSLRRHLPPGRVDGTG